MDDESKLFQLLSFYFYRAALAIIVSTFDIWGREQVLSCLVCWLVGRVAFFPWICPCLGTAFDILGIAPALLPGSGEACDTFRLKVTA